MQNLLVEPRGNLFWYRQHQRIAGAAFWAPAVVLLLIDEFGLARALQLQAVYYAAVVIFEVPSGWLSDRIGRVKTLRVVAVAWIVAHALFLAGDVAAQVLLAVGYASLSGTDVSFHVESLEAEGRTDELEERESAARRDALYAAALTALAGGGLAVVDLRLPFVASRSSSSPSPLGFARSTSGPTIRPDSSPIWVRAPPVFATR